MDFIMHPEFHDELGIMLPDELPFPHFAQREAAWLLARRMAGPTRIADLRRSPLAPLLKRPGPAQVIAACGDGRLTPERLLPLADPLYAFGREGLMANDCATRTAFDLACAAEWRDFSVSFARWGTTSEDEDDWHWMQTSRAGANLVLQVNFPDAYSGRFLSVFGHEMRDALEYYLHPVRQTGPITMGWARLDFEPWGEDMLIEEIQTDWLREIKRERKRLLNGVQKGHYLAAHAVLEATEAFAADWSRVIMLAVLAFATREMGMRRIWMHQPRTGAKLKRIRDVLPPRSIYTDLPRRFGFTETHRAPDFLYRARPQALARLRRSGRPVFWTLDLTEPAAMRVAA